jgi:prefoldin subunit 5
MGYARVGLAAMALAALVSSSSLARADSGAIHCPSAAGDQRVDALERQLDALDSQLDRLNDKIDQLADARRDALDRARERIESAVRNDGLSQDQVDREVSHALSEAQARGEAEAREAQSLQHSMDGVRSHMQTLRQQMHILAGRRVDKDPDAG